MKRTPGFDGVPSDPCSLFQIGLAETPVSTVTDTIIFIRYVELMDETRRGVTVLEMRGSARDKRIREYEIDATGMDIGEM